MSTAITKRQREILEILWTNGEATSGDIGRALPDAPTASTDAPTNAPDTTEKTCDQQGLRSGDGCRAEHYTCPTTHCVILCTALRACHSMQVTFGMKV